MKHWVLSPFIEKNNITLRKKKYYLLYLVLTPISVQFEHSIHLLCFFLNNVLPEKNGKVQVGPNEGSVPTYSLQATKVFISFRTIDNVV